MNRKDYCEKEGKGMIFSIASCCIEIEAVVSDEGFVLIRDMEADAVEEFYNRKDFEITFFAFMHGGGMDDVVSFWK